MKTNWNYPNGVAPFGDGKPCRPRMLRWHKVAPFMAALLLLIPCIGLVRSHRPALNARAASAAQKKAASSYHVPWYFRSGQWRADARTLTAMVRYLVTPDFAPPTNSAPLTNSPRVPA